MKYRRHFFFKIGNLRLRKGTKIAVFLEKVKSFLINKRQRFVLSVIVLSLGLFFSEHRISLYAIIFSLLLALVTNLLFFLSTHTDTKENISIQLFILPFFYSLAFALFYFLVPYRFLTKAITASFYGIGLYSLFLSHNIFVVASIRTIALASSARIVSLILTLISYFFLSNVILSLDFPLIPTVVLIFLVSFFLILHSIWTYTLEKLNWAQIAWASLLSLCLMDIAFILWFWPSSPIFLAIFLTGFFYTVVGLFHVWLDKRLFKGVLWEYVWVAVIVFCILIISTPWKG